jgi:hypothetical protein
MVLIIVFFIKKKKKKKKKDLRLPSCFCRKPSCSDWKRVSAISEVGWAAFCPPLLLFCIKKSLDGNICVLLVITNGTVHAILKQYEIPFLKYLLLLWSWHALMILSS